MTTNTSFYAVPAAWAVALLPRGYALATFTKHSKLKPELQNPRSWATKIAQDPTIPPLIRDRLIRAESAQLNGLENMGYFAAAVAVGNAAGLDAPLINRLAWGYVISRLFYNYIFIHNDTRRFVFVRTLVFFVGIVINTSLFVLAGWNWRSK